MLDAKHTHLILVTCWIEGHRARTRKDVRLVQFLFDSLVSFDELWTEPVFQQSIQRES